MKLKIKNKNKKPYVIKFDNYCLIVRTNNKVIKILSKKCARLKNTTC